MTMQDHADAGSTEREQAGTADTPLTQAVARAFSVATPGAIHILRDWHTRRPWWPTEQRFDCSPDKVVVTDCCLRRLPAKETICYLRCQEFPLGGYGDYQELESFPSAVYRNGEKIGERRAAVNWFSYFSLRKALRALGFETLDRFDVNNTQNRKGLPRYVLLAIQNIPFLRWLAHVFVQGTLVVAIKGKTHHVQKID